MDCASGRLHCCRDSRSHAGDRIQVMPGVYHEGRPGDLNALTITTDGIELVGCRIRIIQSCWKIRARRAMGKAAQSKSIGKTANCRVSEGARWLLIVSFGDRAIRIGRTHPNAVVGLALQRTSLARSYKQSAEALLESALKSGERIGSLRRRRRAHAKACRVPGRLCAAQVRNDPRFLNDHAILRAGTRGKPPIKSK